MPNHRTILAARVLALREHGYLYREIAERLGISLSYASDLANDPDGSKARARKESYGRPCIVCWKPTSGSNGTAKAPKRCASCAADRTRAGHGTHAMYQKHGCRCDKCRSFNTDTHRRWYQARKAAS